MIKFWMIVSYLMVAITSFKLKPAPILLTRPEKRHKSNLQSKLK